MDRLYELLAEQNANRQRALGMPAGDGGPSALARTMQDQQSELQSLLGSKYPKWQEYNTELPTRRQVKDLAAVLGSAGAPLSDAQSNSLIPVLAAVEKRNTQERMAQSGPPSLTAGMTRYSPEANQRILDAAAPHLTPQQLESYRQMLERQSNQESSMRNMMIDAQKRAEAMRQGHLRGGSTHHTLAASGEGVARLRLPVDANLRPVPYGQPLHYGPVQVSLHPAGHILGSSQVRIACDGQVWVVSGDYKRDPDPTCAPFEVVPCDVFISEATFALPVYRWTETREVAEDIHRWWQRNRERGVASLLYAYALGKAQRVLSELTAFTDEPVYLHGAVASITDAYRAAGVAMLPTLDATVSRSRDYAGALVIAPPSAAGSPWVRRFGEHSSGFCSGWMRVRGDRRRRGYDRGFVISDHADWPSLLRTFRETGARRILLTHGHSDTMVRYLREQQVDAAALASEYGTELVVGSVAALGIGRRGRAGSRGTCANTKNDPRWQILAERHESPCDTQATLGTSFTPRARSTFSAVLKLGFPFAESAL